MSVIRLAGIVPESITDGPGLRFTVFTQGCPHRCVGCHNPETWQLEGGYDSTTDQLISEMKKNPLLKGITLSGGEPFLQSTSLAGLAEAAHTSGFDVITFTGYSFEELLEMTKSDDGVMALLRQTDILIDGRFVQELKSYDLNFKGSSNQRAIDVKRSLENGRVVLSAIMV